MMNENNLMRNPWISCNYFHSISVHPMVYS